MKTDDFEDDGRVIADMSQVEHRRNFIPRLPKNGAARGRGGADVSNEEKKAAVSGAIAAALLIAGIFIACGAVLILLLQTIWR